MTGGGTIDNVRRHKCWRTETVPLDEEEVWVEMTGKEGPCFHLHIMNKHKRQQELLEHENYSPLTLYKANIYMLYSVSELIFDWYQILSVKKYTAVINF